MRALAYYSAFILICTSCVGAIFQPLGVPFKSPVTVAPGFASSVIFSNLTTPRGIAFDSRSNVLVVERTLGVTAFSPVHHPTAGWERTVVIQNPNFTQGIQVDGSKLYVSTAGDTLVYQYDAETKSVSASDPPYSIVTGIPADGELTTHTLQLERGGSGKAVAILVASGPKINIDPSARDPSSGRSQIRRFVFPTIAPAIFPPPPLQWTNGQVIAFGIRNPAGFAFSPNVPALGNAPRTTSLFVVENGASIDGTANFTAAFVNDNPADELELVSYSTDTAGLSTVSPKFYGFPDCTTLWNGSADPIGNPQFIGNPPGYQFSLQLESSRDDAWCQSKTNNQPPVLSFQAHSVPLDIKFYAPASITSAKSAFPAGFKNQAFVSFHGSFNRVPPTGYGVVRVPSPNSASIGNIDYSFIIQATDLNSCPGNCIRPVGLAFGTDGRLYVSSDSSGELFVIEKA